MFEGTCAHGIRRGRSNHNHQKKISWRTMCASRKPSRLVVDTHNPKIQYSHIYQRNACSATLMREKFALEEQGGVWLLFHMSSSRHKVLDRSHHHRSSGIIIIIIIIISIITTMGVSRLIRVRIEDDHRTSFSKSNQPNSQAVTRIIRMSGTTFCARVLLNNMDPYRFDIVNRLRGRAQTHWR